MVQIDEMDREMPDSCFMLFAVDASSITVISDALYGVPERTC